jgi:hypothetical protein
MRKFVRPLAAILPIICIVVVSGGDGMAQTKPLAAPVQASPPSAQSPALKQMALTDKQIEGVLAAQKEMDQLDAIAKKNGFASYDEYNDVIDNISLVLGGIDPATKKHVGPEAIIKAQIAEIQADNNMPANDKKQALADLNEALKAPSPPIENKGNIDVVMKYYDRLADALGDDQQ